MEKIIKESFIYKLIMRMMGWLSKETHNSAIINIFLKDTYNEKNAKDSLIVKFLELLLKFIRNISARLKLDKLFNNSIFAKPIIWVGLTIAVAPILPTMMVLALVIASALSLLLKAAITPSFEFKHYKINSWIFAFIVVIGISAMISISMLESIKIAMLMIAFVLFYFVIINTVTTKKELKSILYIITTIGALTAIYGIYQYVFGDVYSQAWLDKEMFEEIKMRVYSTLENPNVYGEYLLLIIPMMIGLFWSEKNWLKKLFLIACSGVCMLALVLTFSRGCWIGMLFALAVLALIIDKRFIFLGIAVLFMAPFVLPETIINRFMSIGNMSDSSTSYRVYIWFGTLAMLKDFWLSGVGMGITSFNTIYPLYSYNNISAPHSHNLYLQLVVEYGIIGLITMGGVIYNFFKEIAISMKKHKSIVLGGLASGMLGFLLQSMTDHTWYNYRVVLMFFVMIGLSVSLSKINLEENK